MGERTLTLGSAVHGIDACDAEEISVMLDDAIAIAEMMLRSADMGGMAFREKTIPRIGGMLLEILDKASEMLRPAQEEAA